MKNLRGALQFAALSVAGLVLIGAVWNYMENHLTVEQYAKRVCGEIMPETFLEGASLERQIGELEWGIERMEAITAPLWLWYYHRSLTDMLREIHKTLTLGEDTPIDAFLNPDEYFRDEMQSIRFSYEILPLTVRSEMQFCPNGRNNG